MRDDIVYLMLWETGEARGLLVQNNGHPLEIPSEGVALDLHNGVEIRNKSYREYFSRYVGKVEVVCLVKQAWTYRKSVLGVIEK